MTFISYAQNFEDVMLKRAFRGISDGFYIDVGANDPESDSITKAFYDVGWHGINIEPLPEHIAALQAARPRDLNLQCAVGATAGELQLWECDIRGWATLDPKAIALHESKGMIGRLQPVAVRTLTEIFARHVPGQVHFLKIDVEGFEAAVLAGTDFSVCRPWVVVIEAIQPDSDLEVYQEWEHLLTTQNYTCAYADGLNRFYVAAEHADLLPAFTYPPNVFDGFERVDLVAARQRGEHSEANLAQVRLELERTQRAVDQANRVALAATQADTRLRADLKTLKAAQLESELQIEAEQAKALAAQTKTQAAQLSVTLMQAQHAQFVALLFASTSWRITAPIRWLGLQRIALQQHGLRQRCIHAINKLARMRNQAAAPVDAAPPAPILQADATMVRFNPAAYRLHPHLALLKPAQSDVCTSAQPANAAQTSPRAYRLVGHIEGHYSLAMVNRGLALALHAAHPGRMAFQPYHGSAYTDPSDIPVSEKSALLSMVKQAATPAPNADNLVSIVHHYPLITDPQQVARHRLTVFFWEETAVPYETIKHINQHFDAVLVASSFVLKALRNSGCDLPIFLMPLGIDHVLDNGLDHGLNNSRNATAETTPVAKINAPAPHQPFRFLHISSAFERKGVDILLRAYLACYSSADTVELVIKTFPNPHNTVRQQWKTLTAGRADVPLLVIDESNLNAAEMLALYRSAHALVLPTRGEGFNLAAAEGMALGLPVIVSGYGGQSDFCTLETAFLLPYRFETSRSHLRSSDACWIEPDSAALGRMLEEVRRAVIVAKPEMLQQLAQAASYVRQTYTWANAAAALHNAANMLDTFASQSAEDRLASPQPKRLGVISPWQTRCGIAEYTQHLLSAPQWAAWDVKIYCDTRTAESTIKKTAGVQVTWALGQEKTLLHSMTLALRTGVDALLIQHQPSLFNLSGSIARRLKTIAQSGITVLLELHSTLPLVGTLRLTQEDVANLKQLDRLIVHHVDDLNNLLQLGLTENVMLLPLGVAASSAEPTSTSLADPARDIANLSNLSNLSSLSSIDDLNQHNVLDDKSSINPTRATFGIDADELVIATFGFLLPHKGVDTLIRSLVPLTIASGKRVRLIALNALMDQRSTALLKEYELLARQLGVFQQIVWINDFHPIAECIAILALSNYVVFPYGETQESASGAVTVGLATRRPVLVSPLRIFSDLGNCVVKMQGNTELDIAKAIRELENNPEKCRIQLEHQDEWLQARSWLHISARLNNTLEGLLIDRKIDQHTIPAPAPKPTLFVDVSELFVRDAKTGIQRVVRSILQAWHEVPPPGYQVCPVVANKGEQYRYTGHFGSANAALSMHWDGEFIQPQAGDIFLGLDLSAHLFPEIETVLAEMRQRGVKICYVIYDLIPILSPQWCAQGIPDAFTHWLAGLARQADTLLCISGAVADDTRQAIHGRFLTAVQPQIRHFHLGADIAQSQPSTGLPDNADLVLTQLKARPSLLMVGTIEARKGHVQALAAFEQLWEAGQDINLVLVGKPGWGVDALLAQLADHPRAGKHLFWLPGISDAYLEQVYAGCTALLAASEAEGFGLPLIEAAQHQLPIIARDIPVFREVAGDHAYYFSGSTAPALAAALQRWLQLHAQGQSPRSDALPWLTWQQSAEQLRLAMVAE
ncbi:FkbM family methyltransferase [Glaciimonas sp. PAMC28666]|uniref:FkbM family methyltransferase n=1 Tax=Glaciimonas sp. PAMC28666 TaxID=2807626 RepID=UPI001965525E|nr:FkbM family methyltransferase [Glaciimonas sp. PAMC28666]QRX84526.1 FkbM family methyltransferase [Glaciimonas sp. PAMC28666]